MAPFAHSAFRLDLDPRVAHSMRLRADPRTHCGAPANHHDASAIHVLAARFPVIRRMVGEQSFRVTAQRFVLSEPPRVPIPPSYGESFPRFLRREGGLSSMEYVADIAALEVARCKAQHAPDARPIDANRSLAWQAEHADHVREVEVRRLPAGGDAFVRALARGQTVAMAARAALGATPEFDSAGTLMILAEADAVIGIRGHG